MRSMTLWNRPWSVWDELGELQGRFNRVLDGVAEGGAGYRPRMDIWGDDEKIVVDVEVPGMDPADVEISVEGDQVTIAGEVKPSEQDEKANVYRRERLGGKFSRTIRIPFPADPKKVTAQCRNGLLRVAVPRAEASKPLKIAIKAA